MLDELLMKYADRFGENLPIFQCMGMDEDELMRIISNALDAGTPYQPPDDNPDVLY